MKIFRLLKKPLKDLFIPKTHDQLELSLEPKPEEEKWELVCSTRALGKIMIIGGTAPVAERKYQEVHTIRVSRSSVTGKMKRDVTIEWSNNKALLMSIFTNLEN